MITTLPSIPCTEPGHCRGASARAKRIPFMHALRRGLGAIVAVMVLVFALQPQAALAQWAQATGTAGIRFVSMSKVGTTIYAGSTANGLYQSTDDGASWSAAFGGYFNTWVVNVVTQVGSVLYVGGTVGYTAAHLAYSTDSGATWTDLTAWGGATNIAHVVLLNGATYVSASGKGVYKSTTNNGTGWVLSNTGMTSQSNVRKLAQVGTDIFVADATNNGSDGVYKSTDNGANWTRVATGLPGSGGAGGELINYNGTLFLTNGSGVYSSSNSGASWSVGVAASPQGLSINNATLYFSKAFSNALYTTTDGATWTSQDVSTITGGSSYLQSGIVLTGGKLLLASGDGIWRETDPAPSYSVTLSSPSNGSVTSNVGGISCGSTCSGYYASGASVTLTATPNSGYVFSNWGGSCSGSTNPLTLSVSANTACTATFAVANAAPTASSVAVSGTAQVNVPLSGGYTYADADSDPQGSSSFRWVRNTANTGVGGGTNVATTQNYTAVVGDQGKYLYFCVTPVATTGTLTGSEVCSSATAAVVAANAAPTASAVTVSGTAQVASPLSGDYTYADAESDAQATSIFQWYSDSASNGAGKAAISGATSTHYAPDSADIGKYLFFCVTPKAQTGTPTGVQACSSATPAIAAASVIPLVSPVQAPGLPAGVSGSQITPLDLATGSGAAMTACLRDILRSILGGDANYLGQIADGSARIGQSASIVSFYALQANTNTSNGLGQGPGIYLRSTNPLNAVTSCGTFLTTPAMYNLTEWGSHLLGLGLAVQINDQGVMTLAVDGSIYVARPDYFVTPGTPGAARLIRGSDGLYRFTDSLGNTQVLYPAFLDPETLGNQIAQSVGGTIEIQGDATALLTRFNGERYVLTPDLTLSPVSEDRLAMGWWQDGPDHFQYRSSSVRSMSQGFSAMRLR